MMLAMLPSQALTVTWGCWKVRDVAVRELKADIHVPMRGYVCANMHICRPCWRVVVGWYKMTPFSEFN